MFATADGVEEWLAMGGAAPTRIIIQSAETARLSRDHLRLAGFEERRFVQRLRPVFSAWADRAASRARSAIISEDAAGLIDGPFESAFLIGVRPALANGWAVGAKFERSWIDAAVGSKSQKNPDIDISADLSQELEAYLDEWLAERGPGLWKTVSRSVKTKLAETIARVIKEGLPIEDRIKELRKVLGEMPGYAVERIARTETTGGMNAGQHRVRDELDIEFKEWVSTIDARNRGNNRKSGFDHLSCHEQVRRNDVPFVVSGQKLMFPGDWNHGASAGNIINCRCAAVAHFKRRKRGGGKEPPPPPEPEPLPPPKKTKPPKPPKVPKEKKPPKPKAVKPTTAPGPKVEPKPPADKRAHIPRVKQMAPDPFGTPDEWQASDITKERIKKSREIRELFKEETAAVRERVLKAGKDLDLDVLKERFTKAHQAVFRAQLPMPVDEFEILAKNLEDAKKAVLNYNKSARAAAHPQIKRSRVGSSKLHEMDDDPVGGDWRQPMEEFFSMMGRGHGVAGDTLYFQIELNTTGREFCRNRTTLSLAKNTAPEIAIHEMGHALEQNPEVAELVKGFLYDRVGSESIKSMKDFGEFYWDHEIGWDDDFGKFWDPSGARYVGKFYGHGSTEVLAMGMQALYEAPLELARKDPEMFEFLVGILNGIYL